MEKKTDLYTYTQRLQARLKTAEQKHITWIKDGDDNFHFDHEKKEGGKFQGSIVLLTDSKCASACLDFADDVMSIPHSIQMGRQAGADTIYNDQGWFDTASGLRLAIPLKVFRHRPRGNNQPYTPQYHFDGDISDTAAVQKWVLATVDQSNIAKTKVAQ